ncbi:hypothetical protein GCM10010298_19550 [Streptomyces microflavus]|uniref:Uncharacterized protein n=1 Tax=Streptomyces microflavus TaxID=1919 RepID=A0A7J0D1D1_STRMI|nr:hypothetical protein Smic_71070 [Streptomyces microflavus]GGX55753.1 hypothetical protein GCM10010298_19550 [Streptomyces microflavus]
MDWVELSTPMTTVRDDMGGLFRLAEWGSCSCGGWGSFGCTANKLRDPRPGEQASGGLATDQGVTPDGDRVHD